MTILFKTNKESQSYTKDVLRSEHLGLYWGRIWKQKKDSKRKSLFVLKDYCMKTIKPKTEEINYQIMTCCVLKYTRFLSFCNCAVQDTKCPKKKKVNKLKTFVGVNNESSSATLPQAERTNGESRASDDKSCKNCRHKEIHLWPPHHVRRQTHALLGKVQRNPDKPICMTWLWKRRRRRYSRYKCKLRSKWCQGHRQR